MNIKIDIYLILSILILFLFHQASVFLIFYFFVIIHELAHIIMALILKIPVKEVNFLPFGVNAKFDFKNQRKKEILVAITGPIISLCLAYFIPQYRVQNLFIAIMNLIPLYPLDGGRILKNLMILKYGLHKTINKYEQILKTLVILLSILNIWLVIYQKKYQFLFVTIYIIQVAGEELKKDKIRKKVKEILNVEI